MSTGCHVEIERHNTEWFNCVDIRTLLGIIVCVGHLCESGSVSVVENGEAQATCLRPAIYPELLLLYVNLIV
jgi:hypothetical protein